MKKKNYNPPLQAIVGVERTVHVWLVGMCLGERRRLVVPKEVKKKYETIFPYMGKYPVMEFEVQLRRINQMTWEEFDSGKRSRGDLVSVTTVHNL